ncbi:MAG TPA: NAD(P)/FAD-dependent oxidoreductase [Vicinamibacterales bacterium]|jgi:phytoene dehydrogenase-like protein|nr:NAD(P)/FAD-dependent oxidoreductase [Vicinamibacterales bacterium]
MTSDRQNVVVVGSGPNGLAAAISLARAGRAVIVFERAPHVGGGLHTAELTLPGFLHDVCSSVYPFGLASPFFRSVPLSSYGIEWANPSVALAHPLDGTDAVSLSGSVDQTAADLGEDRAAYTRLFAPLVDRWEALLDDVLAPPRIPRHPGVLWRFGYDAVRPALDVAMGRFRGPRARALFGGLAAHSTLRLDARPSAAIGLILGAMAHAVGWPFVKGGASRLAEALAAEFTSRGGTIISGRDISDLADVRAGQSVVCDVTPRQLLRLAGDRLPAAYRASLSRYRYGPAVFKVDWALSEAIPWRATACREAGTVHVGGTLDEIAQAEVAACSGAVPERPFVLVTQPTVADGTRAPAGRHVAWGYCHVPHGSPLDMTGRIEAQIERYAPGFQDTILARHVLTPASLERLNPNLVGGHIGGGTMDLGQLFTRPTWRTYRTAAAGVYLCSSSTPPGGGVHGMCGYHAAQAVLRDTERGRKP